MQGIQRFGKRVMEHAEMQGFVKSLLDQMSNG
jgi:hypothetical protein